MKPVWEANHVWLIFVVVTFWTAFPVAFGSVTSTLYLPLFGAAIGIILRGSAFALRGEAATIGEQRILGGAFALSSVLTPFCLGAALGGVASGRVPPGNAAGDPISSWLNPTSAMTGCLAVLIGAHLAAVYMAADADELGLDDLRRGFRIRALMSGVAAGAVALGGLAVLHADARPLYDGLITGAGLACVGVSAVGGAVTLGLVAAGRFAPARLAAGTAVAGITAGWAVAQRPYLLPPYLEISEAAAGRSTLVALLISVAIGLALIGPALALLYVLAVRGRLDESLKPLGQRYRPLGRGDDVPAQRR
jgi:cytochrome d ubiquinol oxidase subunit II